MGYIQFDKNKLINLEYSLDREIIRSNRAGSYASMTIVGCNTRKYHGLLVASVQPPVRRMVLVSKLEETLMVQKDRYDLSCNQYSGTVHPEERVGTS